MSKPDPVCKHRTQQVHVAEAMMRQLVWYDLLVNYELLTQIEAKSARNSKSFRTTTEVIKQCGQSGPQRDLDAAQVTVSRKDKARTLSNLLSVIQEF